MLRSLVSVAALTGGLALLLADDAGPICKLTAFDRTFVVTSGVTSECTPVSETLRISVTPESPQTATVATATIEHVDGEVLVNRAEVSGGCTKDNAPIDYDRVELTMQLTTGSGEPSAHCGFSLDTLAVDCYLDGGAPLPCAVVVTEP